MMPWVLLRVLGALGLALAGTMAVILGLAVLLARLEERG
jgi:hypothetical protein